jgi:hypothetical protein
VSVDYDLDGDRTFTSPMTACPIFSIATTAADASPKWGSCRAQPRGQGKPLGHRRGRGDYDGDGREDLFVANLSFQPSALWNNGDGTFPKELCVGSTTQLVTGYGAGFLGTDNDSFLDLFQTNGNMMDNVALYYDNVTYAEPGQILRNRGDGTFEDVTAAAPTLPAPAWDAAPPSWTWMATASWTWRYRWRREGEIFRNRGVPGRHYLGVLLEGRALNRDGFGAKLVVRAAGRTLFRESRGASDYASQSGG